MAALAVMVLSLCGCTTLQQWLSNGFKVGPNFQVPPAPLAPDWIDRSNPQLSRLPAATEAWWHVFGDPVLTSLIDTAYRQNLDLKTAVTRVLQARAQRNISAGNLFPQSQKLIGDYAHVRLSRNLNLFQGPMGSSFLPGTINIWATGFNVSWELDLWGRLRRAVESADADLSAAVENYHDVLLTLVADVASNYVQIRTLQQRLAFARRNIQIQEGTLQLAEARFRQGKVDSLDVEQARTSLAQTRATVPPLAISLRQANDRLCVLLGLPAQNLVEGLGEAPIPAAPAELAVGIPADLLQRRPDVRRALRDVASQSAQIGMAEADLFPQLGVSGFIGFVADDLARLFAAKSFTTFILPNFQWKILNYGRVVNNIRNQDARFQEKVLNYQKTVLTAGREVEDALEAFLQYQLQKRDLEDSVRAAERSVELVQLQYRQGRVDFNRVFTTQGTLVAQQDQLAAARGNIVASLITAYRALGGGWQAFDNPPSHEGCFLMPPVEQGQ